MLYLRNIAFFLLINTFSLSVFCTDIAKDFLEACAARNVESVRNMLQKYPRDEVQLDLLLNAKDAHNRGPLHVVIKPPLGTSVSANEIEQQKQNTLEIIKLLAIFNADPNAKSNGGFSAMHVACMIDDYSIINALLESFRDILLNIEDDELNTPLHYALDSDNFPEILEAFLRTQKDTGLTQENNYYMPFDRIIGHPQEELLFDLLIKYGHEKIVQKAVQDKIYKYCSLAGKCSPSHLTIPEQNSKDIELFFVKVLGKKRHIILTATPLGVEENILLYIRLLQNNEVEKLLISYQNGSTDISPHLLKKMANEALEYNNIKMFNYLVEYDLNTFNELLDLNKCKEEIVADLLENYLCSEGFARALFIKLWEHGNPSKFKMVFKHLKKDIDIEPSQRQFNDILFKSSTNCLFLDLLIEQIKLDHEAKNKAILSMVFANISEKQKAYLLDRLPLPYLVPYKLYDLIGSKLSPENINNTDDNGYTLLHMAIIYNDTLLLSYLLNEGATLNIVDHDKLFSSFDLAIKKSHTDALDNMLNWLKDNNPLLLQNAVSWAAYYKLPDLVLYFLNKGFDPNAQDPNGNTFLHIALVENMPGLLAILDKFNDSIDYTKTNNANETMLDYANMGGNKKYINFIKKHLNLHNKKRKIEDEQDEDEHNKKRQKINSNNQQTIINLDN